MRTLFFTAVITFSLLTAACAQSPYQSSGKVTLVGLESMTASNESSPDSEKVSKLRLQAIQETATSLGAQGGLYAGTKKINAFLEGTQAELDETFNFNSLLLDHNVLPPVLVESNDIYNLASSDSIRVADKTYKIVRQARFVTTPPNWREYLIMNYSKPEAPNESLLPKNRAEQRVWIKSIQSGWIQGTKQAHTIYLDNVSRLKRDYNGMLLYRELLAQHMVSQPHVTTTQLGVTSNSNASQLYINDKVLRITALPKLNSNAKTWTPVITHD